MLDAQARQLEEVLLRSRLREGLPLKEAGLHGDPGIVLAEVLADGLVEPEPAGQGTVVLTRRGRLLADAVVRALLP